MASTRLNTTPAEHSALAAYTVWYTTQNFSNLAITGTSSQGMYYKDMTVDALSGKKILAVTVAAWSGIKYPVTPFFDASTNKIGVMSVGSQTVSSLTLRVAYRD